MKQYKDCAEPSVNSGGEITQIIICSAGYQLEGKKKKATTTQVWRVWGSYSHNHDHHTTQFRKKYIDSSLRWSTIPA